MHMLARIAHVMDMVTRLSPLYHALLVQLLIPTSHCGHVELNPNECFCQPQTVSRMHHGPSLSGLKPFRNTADSSGDEQQPEAKPHSS